MSAISSVHFTNFKAFREYSVGLGPMNVLVGPNNSGKSTLLGAFRALEVALRKANSKSPETVHTPSGAVRGYFISEASHPISLENVHTNYEEDTQTEVEFVLKSGGRLRLQFWNRGAVLTGATESGGTPASPSAFKKAFPLDIVVVPVLGPMEHKEPLVKPETVRSGLTTHRASRHFRNYWHHFPEGFSEFAEVVTRTWPGMELERPEVIFEDEGATLRMYCRENRWTRELYWSGFGFQIWCQLITHVCRAREDALLIIDEPEIYLHPDVQRQLLAILRARETDVVLATHSTEIMADAEPSEILLIDKSKKVARRLRDAEGVQEALSSIGSIQNITLTHLARNRRVLFVEGHQGFRILRRLAQKLGLHELATGTGLTILESKGLSSYTQILDFSQSIEQAIGAPVKVAAVFSRSHHPEEQLTDITGSLRRACAYSHILERMEIENYLLEPSVLERAVERLHAEHHTGGARGRMPSLESLLQQLTDQLKSDVIGQLAEGRSAYARTTSSSETQKAREEVERRWSTLAERLSIVPGSALLQALRERLLSEYGVALTESSIISALRASDVQPEIRNLLQELDRFSRS